jgi:NADH-quinone oxidoreductase subunit E
MKAEVKDKEPQAEQVSPIDIASIVDKAVEKHGTTREAEIPVLSEVNRALGYIPKEALREVRRRIQHPEEGLFLADSHLYSVVSFYKMFSLRPLGRHVVRFCESAPCHVMGGRLVIKTLQDELGLKPGETSPDNKWSLIMTSCLGVCGVGPVFLVDDDIYGNITPERVHEILARYS